MISNQLLNRAGLFSRSIVPPLLTAITNIKDSMNKIILISFLLIEITTVSAKGIKIQELYGFPSQEEGISFGVSACFAGFIGNRLIMAGGCNFPNKPAAEGGTKRYYKGIYSCKIRKKLRLDWQLIGFLPEEAAYGVSITTKDGIICIGGKNNRHSLTSVFVIHLVNGKAVITTLPSLPYPIDNSTGCKSSKNIFIYGAGQICKMNLSQIDKGWTVFEKFERQRYQPISGILHGKITVWGGFLPKFQNDTARLCLDGFTFGKKIKKRSIPVDELKESIALSGSASVQYGRNKVLAIGGICKDIFLIEFNHPDCTYLRHPIAWYRFNPHILLYDRNKWKILGTSKLTARAGASLAIKKRDIYVIGGEVKPGKRTASVLKIIY